MASGLSSPGLHTWSASYQPLQVRVWAMSNFQVGPYILLLWPLIHICVGHIMFYVVGMANQALIAWAMHYSCLHRIGPSECVYRLWVIIQLAYTLHRFGQLLIYVSANPAVRLGYEKYPHWPICLIALANHSYTYRPYYVLPPHNTCCRNDQSVFIAWASHYSHHAQSVNQNIISGDDNDIFLDTQHGDICAVQTQLQINYFLPFPPWPCFDVWGLANRDFFAAGFSGLEGPASPSRPKFNLVSVVPLFCLDRLGPTTMTSLELTLVHEKNIMKRIGLTT